MRIEIERDDIIKSVVIADSIIQSKIMNPLLSNCMFVIKKNLIEIISTDGDISIRTRVAANNSNEFSFLVNGKRLVQIAKELPKGGIILQIDDSYEVSIRSASKDISGIYKLVGLSAQGFPDITSFSYDNSFEMDQALLKEMLRKVIFAASHEVIKPVFNGIFITSADGMLSTVASDSRRLSAISRTVEHVSDFGQGVVIPLKTVAEVQKLLGAGTCHLAMSGNQFFFKIGDTEIVSRLIDGQFPNYKQVIPRDFSFKVTVQTKKLIEALRRVMIFTREPAFKVLLDFTPGNLKLEAQTADLGEAMEELQVDMDKQGEIVIGVNSQYMMDALREVDSHSVIIGVTGDKSPMVVIPDNDENHVSVIMPIQLKNND